MPWDLSRDLDRAFASGLGTVEVCWRGTQVPGWLNEEDVLERDGSGELVTVRRTVVRIATSAVPEDGQDFDTVRIGAVEYSVRDQAREDDGALTRLVLAKA